jgi:hypothetical protein
VYIQTTTAIIDEKLGRRKRLNIRHMWPRSSQMISSAATSVARAVTSASGTIGRSCRCRNTTAMPATANDPAERPAK